MGKFVCRWCGRGSVACPSRGECLSEQEREKFVAFIEANGRSWRAKLRALWAAGSEELRQVRNIIGPSGLSRVSPYAAKSFASVSRGAEE